MTTTCVRNAPFVVAFDGHRHVYATGDVAWRGGTLIHVGGRFEGDIDEEIDGSRRLVLPGLIDIHCHPSMQAIYRGFTEEPGNPRLFNSGRHLFRQSFEPDPDGELACARFTLAELLAGGVTTIVDLSHSYPGWLDLLTESGIRAWVAPMFRSANWWTDTGQETRYDWDEAAGWRAFEEAQSLMDAAERHPSGRLAAMVAPAQVDTCTRELLQASARLAAETGRPLFTHAAQSFAEFQGMTRRHAKTPIAWLHEIGFLGPRTVLGHAVFTDEHPWALWPTREDLRLLAGTGTAVAHCPTPFARDGTLLHDLGRYRAAGITLGIGTDTHPHSLLEEMRWAEILARVAAGPRHAVSTADILDMATIDAARILGRDDLGRLATGARADVVLVDLDHPAMRPVRDPLRSLLYGATDRAIARVIVGGTTVVEGDRVLTIDRAEAAAAIESAQARAIARMPELDPEGRDADAIMPLSLPRG